MRTYFPNDPAGLRSRAAFFQRIARASRSVSIREELEVLSLKSMEEATALENDLANFALPKEIAGADTRDEQDAPKDRLKKSHGQPGV